MTSLPEDTPAFPLSPDWLERFVASSLRREPVRLLLERDGRHVELAGVAFGVTEYRGKDYAILETEEARHYVDTGKVRDVAPHGRRPINPSGSLS